MSTHSAESPQLTPQQRAAVHHPLTPLVIVAGAGSGKTEVMAQRILAVIESGQARPDQLLGLTFSNKGAGNLRARVKRTLGPDSDVQISTYHGFGAQLVREHALELGVPDDLELLDRPRAWQLLLDVFDEFEFYRRKTGRAGNIVNDALTLASTCADHLVPLDRLREDAERTTAGGFARTTSETADKRLELIPVAERYELQKRRLGFIDYQDQITLAVRLLTEHPAVAEELRSRFPVAVLDEYQDTNVAQRRLLQLLYRTGSAITAVGDDLQSIYAFRGAAVGNLINFEQHFPPAQERRLEVNFRSGPEIVALANRIQAEVREARPKELRAPDGAAPSTIECFVAADDAEEADTIATLICERIAAGSHPGEVAVLCRKRKLTTAIVAALQERSVPIDVVGLGGLLARPEIVDLIAWLEVIALPTPVVATLRLLLGPRYRIGLRDLAALTRHGRTSGAAGRDAMLSGLAAIDSAAGLSAEAWARGKAFAATSEALRAFASSRSLVDVIDHVASISGLWDAGDDDRATENLCRFADLAARFVPVREGRLTGGGLEEVGSFLEYLEVAGDAQEDWAEAVTSDEDAVRIMTIHQAKGLEFDHVFVPGLAGKGSSKLFPDSRSGDNPVTQPTVMPWWLREDTGGFDGPPRTTGEEKRITEVARERRKYEELRLLYVAVTRARRTLTVSAAQWYAGIAGPQGPTEFYDLIAAQTDLVRELFRHPPADVDPGIVAKERLAAAAELARSPRRAGHGGAGAETSPEPARPRRKGQPAADQPSLLAGAGLASPTADGRGTGSAEPPVPRSLSVTSIVSYVRCPKQFYWTAVRPLPRRPSRAAALGTEVHRWIEGLADPQLAFPEADLKPGPVTRGPAAGRGDTDTDTDTGAPDNAGKLAGLRASFLQSPYASLTPTRVEAGFLLAAGQRIIRGRIDATFAREGRTELVDWKTGMAPAAGDPSAATQLELYALAAIAHWGTAPTGLRTTYAYLRHDGPLETVSEDWDDARAAGAAAALDRVSAGLDARRFDAQAGPWCERCDFRIVCPSAQLGSPG